MIYSSLADFCKVWHVITFRLHLLIPYCVALSALLTTSACENPSPPPKSTDPGTVAKQVVAEYLSLPLTDITLVSLEAQEFNDSSLDCPEPDMSYLQVVTRGHRASIEAQGRRFDVRVSGEHGKICRNNKRSGPARQSQRESVVASMAALARQDLAAVLSVEISEIHQLDIRPYDGENQPTGCTPQCPETNKSCGYIIGLFHDGRRFDYHAADGRAAPCPPISRM